MIVYEEKASKDIKNKEIKTAEVEFKGNNFLHLTGIKTELSSRRFYEKCLNGKLSPSEISFDNFGNTQRKLMVLPYLHELLYNNCQIGNHLNGGIYVRADYFVGNSKFILSVGFRYGKNTDYPVTLYNKDIRQLTQPTNKVLAIFIKRTFP